MKNGLPASIATGVCLLCAVACLAASCGQTEGQGSGIEVEDGSLRGELAVYIADGVDGRSETRYTLRSLAGVERSLLFDGEVSLEPGTHLKVWGIDSPDGVRVTSFEQVSPALTQTTSALLGGTPYAPRTFAFVLLDLGAGTGNVTPTSIMGTLITNPESIRNYYINDSYGLQDISAQVFSLPYTFPATCTNMDTSALASALRPMIPGTFNHYLWYLGTRRTQCTWAGLASVGTAQTPTRDTWYNASTNCVVLVQEPGHNFGMQHSSSLGCNGASFADDPNTCTSISAMNAEYGDLFDPMGNGCRHMNAWQKAYQGWFGGCNGVAVTQSGTFTLLPMENRCNGAQFLKIKAARPRTYNRPMAGGGAASTETMAFYYVELRTPVDFDGMLGNRTALTPQILIHAGDDVRTRTQRGVHTYLLDMAPATATFADAALKVGSTFTDPDPAGNIKITATAVSATQATIDVVITGGTGAPTCLDGTTFPSPGPGPESCGPAGSVGGASGTGGVPGTGGTTGTGGRGGTTGGTGGRGGATGSGGAAGGGSPGSGGLIGSGGTLGIGTGGSKPTDAGGVVGPAGGAPGSGVQGISSHADVMSGCACAIEGNSLSWSGGAMTMIAMLFFSSARARRRRV